MTNGSAEHKAWVDKLIGWVGVGLEVWQSCGNKQLHCPEGYLIILLFLSLTDYLHVRTK